MLASWPCECSSGEESGRGRLSGGTAGPSAAPVAAAFARLGFGPCTVREGMGRPMLGLLEEVLMSMALPPLLPNGRSPSCFLLAAVNKHTHTHTCNLDTVCEIKGWKACLNWVGPFRPLTGLVKFIYTHLHWSSLIWRKILPLPQSCANWWNIGPVSQNAQLAFDIDSGHLIQSWM